MGVRADVNMVTTGVDNGVESGNWCTGGGGEFAPQVMKGDSHNQIAAILRILRKHPNSHIAQRVMSTKTRGKQLHTPAILLAGWDRIRLAFGELQPATRRLWHCLLQRNDQTECQTSLGR